MAKFRLVVNTVFYKTYIGPTSQYDPCLKGPTRLVPAGIIVESVPLAYMQGGPKTLVQEPKGGYYACLWETCRTDDNGQMTRLVENEEPPKFVPHDLVRHRTCSAPIGQGIPFSQQNTEPPMKLWYAIVGRLPSQHILAHTAEEARNLMYAFCSDIPPDFMPKKEDIIVTEESMERARVLM